MDYGKLLTAMKELSDAKGLSTDAVLDSLKKGIKSALKKETGDSTDNVVFDIDLSKGMFNVYIAMDIVPQEEIENPCVQISLEDAREISPAYELGGRYLKPVDVTKFNRNYAKKVKQGVHDSVRTEEKRALEGRWNEIQGTTVKAAVTRLEPATGDVYIKLRETEIRLYRRDQIPGEELAAGQHISVFIPTPVKKEIGDGKEDKISFRVTRTAEELVKGVLAAAVPEISDGLVEVKAVSRRPGVRSKVAVFSSDPNVDAVGSCVGPKKSRINEVCRELAGEKVDVVYWSNDPVEFVKQALKPATVIGVNFRDNINKSCEVTVPDNQLSLAIGAKGINAALAAKLTGMKIDIKPESGFFTRENENDNN
ncbi:MAG: transcription termination factor NusA [Oscillospiraceae bacterium]|jgi:N utilization substance protein A|nr:transcription termination factor NusA [Oscillospiraceae bacterium]